MRINLRHSMLCALGALSIALAPAAFADERMAGKMPGSSESRANTPAKKVTQALYQPPEARDLEDKPATLDVNYTVLESHGTLNSLRDGSLGPDIWNGSERENLVKIIENAPAGNEYLTAQSLLRRLLLTQANAGLIKGAQKPEAGKDLLAVRLDKLMTIGAYNEASDLYAKLSRDPYHEALAQKGMLSYLYAGKAPLACLENKVIGSRFEGETFWQQLESFCTYIMYKDAKEAKAPKVDIPDSKILDKIVSKPKYRYKPDTPMDFETMTGLEKAALFTDDRLDFSSFEYEHPSALGPSLLSLILASPSYPDDKKRVLYIYAVKKGLKSTDDLAAYYKSIEFQGINMSNAPLDKVDVVPEWKKLPLLYQITEKNKKSGENELFFKKLFSVAGKGPVEAALPFSSVIEGTSAESLNSDMIRFGLKILVKSGKRVPEDWQKKWIAFLQDSGKIAKPDLILWIAASLEDKNLPSYMPETPVFLDNFEDFGQNELELIKIIYEKLDKTSKLHNYMARKVYDKEMGLTFANDYVMPSISLLDALEKAKNNNSLGEVVLVSSIVLHDVPPQRMHAGLIREVLDGFVTVGLTNEARDLAREAVLGLSE